MVSMLSSRTTIFSAILFLSLSTGVLTLGPLSANVIFNDLIKWNTTCGEVERCREDKFSNDVGSSVKCHCDRKCTFLGTCCADCKYRTRYGLGTGGFSCRNPNREFGLYPNLPGKNISLFMIDRCKRNWNGEDFVQDLCLGDGKALNDPQLIVPVTSPGTGITYRNYFCFACNEDTESVLPVLWKVQAYSDSKNVIGGFQTNLQYNETRGEWTVPGIEAPIHFVSTIPKDLKQFEVPCVESVIQTCAEGWTDLATKVKCEAYMFLVWKNTGFGIGVYRNPHCAICNFADVSEIACYPRSVYARRLPRERIKRQLIRDFFPDLRNRCGRYEMFDPLRQKCRPVRCAQNQVWYQGECRNRF